MQPEQPNADVDQTHIMFCLDEMGNRLYRFTHGRAGYDEWEARQKPPFWAQEVVKIAPYLHPRRPEPGAC